MCDTQEKKLQYHTSWELDATRFYLITHRPSKFAQAACRCMHLQAYATAATVSRAVEVRLVKQPHHLASIHMSNSRTQSGPILITQG